MHQVAGRKFLILGMAKSGIAVGGLLRRHGAEITASDTRPIENLEFPFVLQSDSVWKGFDTLILSPGVPADLPLCQAARDAGVKVIGDVEAASWYLRGKTIGITGSNGKTTTTALTGYILAQCGIASQVGGNIGLPVASMVDTATDATWNVLELSSFQLETTDRFRPDIGAALNVTPNHLDRHKTLDLYAAAKYRMFVNQTESDFAVLNAENQITVRYSAMVRSQVRWFNAGAPVERGVWIGNGNVVAEGTNVMPVAEIPLRGRHNLENVCAATAMAQLAGAPLEGIRAAVRTFPGVEHRIEFVRTLAGVDYYNDSKATSVDATLKAIEALPAPLWIILGGKDKGSDYTVMRGPLAEKAKGALLVGAAAAKIADHLDNAIPIEQCGTIEVAVQRAFRAAKSGDTVLLAPACASFDQFQSFEHRGQVFKDLVRALPENQ